MFKKNKLKIKLKKQKQGFTLIETLIMVLIIALAATTLVLTVRSMVIANQKLKNVQTVTAHIQEFMQYFTKTVRTSKLEAISGDQKCILVDWQKSEGAVGQYNSEKISFGSDSSCNILPYNASGVTQQKLGKFFPAGMDIDINFQAEGFSANNRVTIFLEVTIDKDLPTEVSIPVQNTISFRQFQ